MPNDNRQPELRHLTDQYELTEEELATTLTAVMETHPRGEDLWVFGYGSLMWQPEFAYRQRALATVHGYHRAFCVYSHIWRGTREKPGLVLGLDNGGSCRGVAYRVDYRHAESTVEYLIRREMVTRVYIPRWVTGKIGKQVIRAHTYTATHNHVQYAGKLSDETAYCSTSCRATVAAARIRSILRTPLGISMNSRLLTARCRACASWWR